MDRKEEYNKIAEKIVGHVKNGTTDQATNVISIPTSDYTCLLYTSDAADE